MTRLHPVPEVAFDCPHCATPLEPIGWYMPGMRTLAELRCAGCGRDYYGDAPAGHGLAHPVLLDRATGEVHHNETLTIFADLLRESYANRVAAPPAFEVESFRPPRQPILLNCLDWVYGHALLKLLNAQHHLDRGEGDLIVLVPRALRWMVPDGPAEIWTVDLPFSRGAEWNDGLDREIRGRIELTAECRLSFAFSHPHPDDFQIERFTRIAPFRLDEWAATARSPVLTFIWRSDRGWGPRPGTTGVARGKRALRRLAGQPPVADTTHRQVVELGDRLRDRIPSLDFAVAGLAGGGPLPGWMTDLRVEEYDAETERRWCERYARSHLVIGVHGSHMLLPTAHAGGLIEMVTYNRWDSRWGNLVQDVLVRGDDVRDAMFRHRFLPDDTRPDEVAAVVQDVLRYRAMAELYFSRERTSHEAMAHHWRELPGEYVAARW